MKITDFVLLLTLLAVLWYSWETRKLRILSKRQIELSQEHMELTLKPHLEIIFQRAHFRLYNVGNGPAIHIRIDDAIVPLPQLPSVRLKFSCPPIISKDECLPIEIKRLWEETGREADAGPGIYTPPLGTETVAIKVHFENLIGKEYVHKLVIGKGMPINSDPVDFLLQYLYEKLPNEVNPEEIPALYVDPKERMKLLTYCCAKGLVDATAVLGGDIRDAVINSKGIDYLTGKG